jgi:sec-independent protein translocase protein TatC
MSKRNRAAEMPFLDHLEELRWRLLRSIAAIVIGSIIGFVIVSHFNVLELLIDPIRPVIGDEKLKYLSPGDPFFVTLGLALTVGFLLAFPIVVSQVWGFVSPALLPREKRAIVPALYLGLVLFMGGVALAYYVALPMTLVFFSKFQTQSLEQNIVIGPYIGLVVKVLLAFGVLFELPVVVLVLASLGLVTSKFLSEKRRIAIASIAVVAAFATPGDAVSLTIFMMGPLILLYELSILLARFVERRRRRSLAMAAAAIAGALLLWAPPAVAQERPARPRAVQQDTTPRKSAREVALEKLRRLNRTESPDTTLQDSLMAPPERARPTTTRSQAAQPSADFPTDSVMRELLRLTDFAATQYKGDSAQFIADSSRLVLFGTKEVKAGVVREGQAMTADSLLTFDQETAVACGYGSPVLSGGASESPVESELLCYNTRERVGMALGARTQVSEGANWFITGDLYSRDKNLYTHDAKFTDCSLEVPHYHFSASDVKVINDNIMVARNVTLNFGDVPVFWLPFMMQSLKKGRRSGLIFPEFSVNDIVRRNSSYDRRITDLGFYWAVNDQLGAKVAMDWWSDNFTALSGSFDYNLLNHFMSGGATFKRFWQSSGSRQFTVAANHGWEPNERTNIRLDGSYATSTSFIKQQSVDPRELNRSITSNLGLTRRFNWGQTSLQASRIHHLTDDKVDLTLPSLGVNFSTVTLFPGATWTASTQVRRTLTDFANTANDPSTLTGGATSNLTLGPFSWSQAIDASENRTQSISTRDTLENSQGGETPQPIVRDTALITGQRITWRSGLSFQQRLIGTTTFTPSINVAREMARSDTINDNRLFSAPLRMDASAAVKMDLFGFWPGIGALSRIRHRLSPSISYSYSPEAKVSPEDSVTMQRLGLPGARERNTIQLGLSQTFEGKYKEDAKREGEQADSAAIDSTSVDPTRPRRLPQARKVTILSLNTDAVLYDFVAARRGETGIQTQQISNSVNSDLLRGLQLTVTHDLFAPLATSTSDSVAAPRKRDWDPHLTRVSASFSLSNNSWLFRLFGLGKKTDAAPATGSQETATGDDAGGGIAPSDAQRTATKLIGERTRDTGPTPRGPVGAWNASFNLTLERPRIPVDTLAVAPSANQMMTTNFSFQPTPQWHVSWQTGYSFTTKEFTDHYLTFTRQLHDWDANFNFVKAQNGNFSFQFNVKLRANPDIKFDYSQRSNINRSLQ